MRTRLITLIVAMSCMACEPVPGLVDDKTTLAVPASLTDSGPANTSGAVQPASPAKPIQDNEPGVTEQVRAMLLQHADGSVSPELFTEKSRAIVFPDQAKALGAKMRACGPQMTLQLLERKVDGEDRLYRYRALCQNEKLIVDITFNKANKINKLVTKTE